MRTKYFHYKRANASCLVTPVHGAVIALKYYPTHNKFYFISVRNLHRKRKLNATPGGRAGGGQGEEREKGRRRESSWKIRRAKKRRDTLDLRVARAVDFVSSPDRVICATFRNRSFPPWRARTRDYRQRYA